MKYFQDGDVLVKNTPDILNSKIKKIRIELPHYSFSHSSSGDSSHAFIGRERIREKLKKVIEDSPDEPGVYLIAGNRGVGKTSLVSWVINETSLPPKSKFSDNLMYVVFLLLAVAGTQFLQQKFAIPLIISVIFGVISSFFFITLGCFNCYRRKNLKQVCGFFGKIWNLIKSVINGITSAIKELSYLINPHNPNGKTQYVLKIILIVCYTQICSMLQNITPTQAFVFYLCFVVAFMFHRFIRSKLREYYVKYKKDRLLDKNIYDIENNGLIRWIHCIYKYYTTLMLLFLPLVPFDFVDKLLIMFIPLLFIVIIIASVWCYIYLKKDIWFKCIIQIIFQDLILNPIKNYIKNHNRLYLRVNFGHKLKDERDILRLIARTLRTEYHKYHHSFRRMLPRRVMAFGILFLFAYLFSPIIKDKEFYKSLIKGKEFNSASSIGNTLVTINVKTIVDSASEIYSKKEIKKTELCSKTGNVCSNILLALDQIFYEIKKIVKKSPQYFWEGTEYSSDEETSPINYLFWLSFFLMYLFYNLLFRCTWITHFFVTHQIITQKLKKLNIDITHNTERENSINLNSGSAGAGIGTRTKKSRNIADAREIEKELQDIFYDIQRIPVIMCRPNIVIVFDELDKVEPGDTSSEKENLQTKASLFSIDATRDRQTEILKILSNMKYFLSSTHAKFIFIAGREMFDIHLADVSERNNYIGSIFNVVILVPSFLTGHHTGEKSLPQESSIASLPEEFVCRKLIPHDYPVESYNLKNYRTYLRRERICDVVQDKEEKREIEQQINFIINRVKNDEIKQLKKIIEEQNEEIEQIVTNQNKKIKKKIKKIITSVGEKNPEQRIKDIIAYVKNEEIKQIREITGKNEKIEQIIIKQNNELEQQINNIGQEKIQKIIAVVQQFIIYLAHVSKGAPKKMIQLFESFIEIHSEREDKKNTLFVQRYHNSRYFLSFNYYKQYTLGIIAYLITPIFYRLAESNVKEHSDKLLVSSLRFVDFLFKFHKHSFSWKILDISPEMLEVNRAPELKSVVVDLLNYLAQVYINKSNFSLSEYKFDSLIANEFFAMAKTDEVFSALFSFSLDEMLPLKKHYQDLLEKTQEEYQNRKKSSIFEFIDAISSLQIVLGDLCYFNDELEEAEVYYKSVVQALNKLEQKITLEHFYIYVRNMLRLGMIYEKRKQYDFAYLTYGDLCTRIIRGRDIRICSPRSLYYKEISPDKNDMFFKKMTYEGLKILYLPFIAKLQILELSHIGGITRNHLEQLDKEFNYLTYDIDHEEAKLLEAEFYSRVADILYYKNSDLKCKKKKNRGEDNDEDKPCEKIDNDDILTEISYENYSCTACYYYHKALSILLGKPYFDESDKKNKNTVIELLYASVEQIEKNDSKNYNVKYCTILSRILSDWGNVFFSCDTKNKKDECGCYICDGKDYNTRQECHNCACYIYEIDIFEANRLSVILEKYINYVEPESKEDSRNVILKNFYNIINSDKNITKMEIAFAMYTISSEAYCKSNLYKRSAYQIYKMLNLFKHYEIYKSNVSGEYIEKLSKKAIHYLWYANEDLNVLELNKRKKDFDKTMISENIPLQNLLVDSEITRIWIMVKRLELKSIEMPDEIKKYYDMRITSPYKINYSIEEHIYRLWLKSKVNYKAYQKLLENSETTGNILSEIKNILEKNDCNNVAKEIFGNYFNFGITIDDEKKAKIEIFENIIAETIYCLIDISQLTETMDETFVFTHSFLGSIHRRLSYWIRRYEMYEVYKKEKPDIDKVSRIEKYLKQYLDEEWREQLSGYRENQRALSHYYKCLEMHNEGRAYHNMIDTMVYLRDDYNDRSDHFNIAEERFLILKGKVDEEIKEIKDIYKESKLYDVDNYFGSS